MAAIMQKNVSTILTALAKYDVKSTGENKWKCFCPCHQDTKKPNLDVTVKSDGTVLVYCQACGAKGADVCKALGVPLSMLFAGSDRRQPLRRSTKPARPKAVFPELPAQWQNHPIITWYDYCGPGENLLYKVARTHPKTDFPPICQVKGGWSWGLNGHPRMLYRLPQLVKADQKAPIFVCEGEKDADNVVELGLVATTPLGGANKWQSEYNLYFADRRVVLLEDNDDTGRANVQKIAAELAGVATDVRILSLPGLPDKGDISDWISQGHTGEELLQLVRQTSPYVHEPCNAGDKTSSGGDKDGVLSLSQRHSAKKLQPYEPFPIDTLPEPAKGFVIGVSRAIGCDQAYVALPLLSVLAASIGNSRRIEVKENTWWEPSVIWTAIVGESGTMKSPALEAPLKPFFDKQRKALQQSDEDMEQYETDMLAYNADLADWKKTGRKNHGPAPEEPEKPIGQRLWCSDITIEALAVRLEEAPRGLLLVCDELAGWLNSFNQYKGGRGSDSAHWLSMYGARPLLIDRKTGDKPTINIPRAAVSITGGIQPVILQRALGQEHFDDGMAARLLLAKPPRKVKQWTDHVSSKSVEAKLEEIVTRLLALEATVLADGDPCPIDLRLTDSGQKAFINFFNSHNIEMAELYGEEAAAWSKLEGYAARFALVIHCVRCAADDPTIENQYAIDEKSVAAGVELTRWFGRETQRVYTILSESEENRNNRRWVEMIQLKGGQVTVRDWQRMRHHLTSSDAKTELKTLVELNLGHLKPVRPNSKGGHPSEIFILCDTCDSDTTSSEEPETEVLSPLQTPQDNPPSDEPDDWGEI